MTFNLNSIDASDIISFVALILSIFGTLIIPKCKNIKEQKRLQEELDDFKSMLSKEYIQEFNDGFNNLKEINKERRNSEERGNNKDTKDNKDREYTSMESVLRDIFKEKTERLKDILEKEIIYMSSENQFKIIRMIEFTLTYFTESFGLLNIYSNSISCETEKVRLEGLEKLTKLYKSKIDDYINLKTDYLITNKEFKEISDRIIKEYHRTT